MTEKIAGFEGFDPSAYKKVYDVWSRSFAEMFDQMMKTPAFAATMGKALEQSVDLKKQFDDMIEESLKHMRLPTMTDMKELHRQLNALTVQLDRVEERLERVEESLKRRS